MVRVVGAALAVLTLLASSARADDSEALILKGLQLRGDRRDREALAEFQRAVAIKETPRAVAQIGLAEQALGLWVEAEAHLGKAIDQDGDPWIHKNRRVLEDAMSEVKGHLGTVEIWGTPEGAEVLLAGKLIGRLPSAKVRAPSEDAQLLVRLPGYVEVSRVLQIPKRSLVREHVELLPVPAEAAKPSVAAAEPPRKAAEAPPAATLAEPAGIAGTPAPPPAPAPSDSTSGRRALKWVTFGLGVAALAGGVAENIVAATKASSFNTSHCTKDRQGVIAGGSDCAQLDHDQTNATRFAVVGYSVAGALLVTALVLHLTEPTPASSRTASASCAPTIGPVAGLGPLAGLGCRIIW